MKLTSQETAQFCRSLALLLHAGIPAADGLFLLSQEETGIREQWLLDLGKQLDQGLRLSEAMIRSEAFPVHASGMVSIGEETGSLEEALNTLADYYEERHRTARQIKNALAYPSLILVLMLGVIGVLLIYVLPVFEGVYASLGGGMRGLSATLLMLGQGLKAFLPGLLVLLAVLAAAGGLLALCPSLRERCFAAVRRWFGDRGVARKFNNARFARALAMGMGSGLSLEDSLNLAGQLLEDIPEAARRCADCEEQLRQGASLSKCLDAAGLLTPAQSRMLTVGLRSGNADRVMEELADRMMEEAEETLDGAVARIEPAMVLGASVLVGAILLAVMLPLLDIMSTIG